MRIVLVRTDFPILIWTLGDARDMSPSRRDTDADRYRRSDHVVHIEIACPKPVGIAS